MVKKGLGKGLGALIASEANDDNTGIIEIRINEIEPNSDQPRKYFDDDKLFINVYKSDGNTDDITGNYNFNTKSLELIKL